MEELNNQIREKVAQRDAIVAELKQLTAQRNKLEAEQSAQEIYNSLSNEQRIALQSIPSTSQMGQM